MITQVTSFSRNGMSDWIVQRVSAYILATYTVLLVGIMLLQGEITYSSWQALFSQTWMQVMTLLTILATCAHACARPGTAKGTGRPGEAKQQTHPAEPRPFSESKIG